MEQRNSYSKTDKDATFMRLKDDHMKNGQLKPAYNIQCATNGDYVVDIEGFSNPTDMRTQPPFIDKLLNKYPSKIERVVADSGSYLVCGRWSRGELEIMGVEYESVQFDIAI